MEAETATAEQIHVRKSLLVLCDEVSSLIDTRLKDLEERLTDLGAMVEWEKQEGVPTNKKLWKKGQIVGSSYHSDEEIDRWKNRSDRVRQESV